MLQFLAKCLRASERALIGVRWQGLLWLLACCGLAATEAAAADYGMHMFEPRPAAISLPSLAWDADVASEANSPSSPQTQPGPGEAFMRIPGHVLAGVASLQAAKNAHGASTRASIHLTLVFNRDDSAGFDEYLKEIYDPQSPQYRRFLSQAMLTERFGPSINTYKRAIRYFQEQGLQVEARSQNRLTLSVQGSRAAVEHALRLELRDYRQGDRNFYTASVDPALPTDIASHVLAIQGLSTLATPQPAIKGISITVCQGQQGPNGTVLVNSSWSKKCVKVTKTVIPLFANILCALSLMTAGGVANAASGGAAFWAGAGATGAGMIYNSFCPFTNFNQNLNNLGGALGSGARSGAAAKREISAAFLAGAGQKIGLLEFDTFNMSDISNYLSLVGAPASQISNLSVVPVNGGVAAPGSGEAEVLMDIDTVMALAPGAKVVVYDAPFQGHAADYSTLFNAMINDGVSVISNSWSSCEDQVSKAEALGVDAVLQAAAASGISVFNGSGDSGSTCLDGKANTIGVPADSPNATAVGGTSLPNGFGQGGTYNGESWWDGSGDTPATGQGGYGVSQYFTLPAYQSGVASGAMRSVPDVAILADPEFGLAICQADNGGCPSGTLNGGTSLAAPEWAAVAALLNQQQGKNLGLFNTALYPLANTTAFHNAASMGSDFQHVGLGSPNIGEINRLLKGQTAGAAVAKNSLIHALPPEVNATFKADASFTIPADGATPGGVLVNLMDANGNTVSGKTVTLTAQSGNAVISAASGPSSIDAGAVIFTLTDLTPETVTFTPTDVTDGVTLSPVTLTFGVPPAASAGISGNPSTVAADGQTPATVTVTLTDALNRPTPGKTIAISDGGAHAVITAPNPAVTDANGQIQLTVTDQVNETVTFTAVDITDGRLPVPGSAVVTYSNSTSTACNVGVAPVAAQAYSVTKFVTGLPAASTVFYQNVNFGCPGAENPAFTSSGQVLVSDFLTGGIYQTGLSGGAVTSAQILNTATTSVGNLVYGKDGSVYATEGGGSGQIIQINPSTGATLRVVASGLVCPAGLSVDPLSGDLFFDDQCTGAGDDNPSIYRVIDPANTDPSKPTSVVVYATLPTTPNGGMAFAPNGTLYAVSGYFVSPNAQVLQVSGTNVSATTVTPVTGVTSDYAVSIGVTNPDGSAQSLIVEPNGTLSEVPIGNPTAATIIATGSPGVGVTGPDGCLYSGRYDTVYRIANSTGGCNFAPTSPAPFITLAASPTSPAPATGSNMTLTAVIHNVSALAGIPVTFSVVGRNLVNGVAPTDATGKATFSYTSALPGTDTALAAGSVNSATLYSNTVGYSWSAGLDLTELTLNASPQGALLGQPVTVIASLTDLSLSTPTPIAGQSVTLSSGGASCTATTSSAGAASCTLTPTQAGLKALTANFGGTSQLMAAQVSTGFAVSAPSASAPSVTISVSPSSIAAGSSATLTWSAPNATSCTASGAWTGTEPASGTQTVTPTASGQYSYSLSCNGPGGTGNATAVLAATLATVVVHAHSGGGALSELTLALLGLLALLRLAMAWRRAAPLAARASYRHTGLVLAVLILVGAAHDARADGTENSALDHVYVGVRAGDMPVNLSAAHLDERLASFGYSGVTASPTHDGFGGTLFVGYEVASYAAVEFGYTHRASHAATLTGTLASNASVAPLLVDTTGLLRGYGNIFALAFTSRIEVLPRWSISPRIGAFYWNTRVTASAGNETEHATHSGGGLTLGVGTAYRLWRGLELGVGADYFDGAPNNTAILYSGSLEWHFGRH